MKNKKRSVILTFVWVLFLIGTFYLLEQPGSESAELSGKFTAFVLRVLRFLQVDEGDLEYLLRKIAHFSLFAISGFLGQFSLRSLIGRRAFLSNLGIHTFLCVISELLQTIAEQRGCSAVDMLIDFSGAIIGIFASILILKIVTGRDERT